MSLRRGLLFAVSATLLAGCISDQGEMVTSVVLELAQDTVAPGAGLAFDVVVLGSDGQQLAGRPVSLVSSNALVLAVGEGNAVAAVREGTADLTASVEGVEATATVTVRGRVAAVAIAAPVDSIVVGQTLLLTALPRDSAGRLMTTVLFQPRAVQWRSLDPARATVSPAGTVTGIAAGAVGIEAVVDGIGAVDTVRVLVRVDSLDVALSADSIGPGDTLRLTARVLDAAGNLVNRVVVWRSSDLSKVVVVNDLALGVGEGTARIVGLVEGVSDSAVLSVRYAVASVSIAAPSDTLTVGDTMRLVATARDWRSQFVPGRTVSWQSLDTVRATVSTTGLVRSITPGFVTFVATVEGILARDTIRMLSRVDSVRITPSPVLLTRGDSVQLQATVIDITGQVVTDHAVSWRTAGSGSATISPTGWLRGVAAGTGSAFAAAGGREGSAPITVSNTPPADLRGEWAITYELYDYYSPLCSGSASLTVTQAGGVVTGQAYSDGALCYLDNGPVGISGTVSELQITLDVGTCRLEGHADHQPTADSISGPMFCGGWWYAGNWSARRAGAPVSMSLTPATSALVIEAAVLVRPDIRDARGNRLHGRTLTWQSDAPAVASIDAAGVIMAHQPGSATISGSIAGLTGLFRVDVTAMPLAVMSAGSDHTCGLTTGGAAFCWGLNNRYALGDTTRNDRVTAVPVVTPTSFTRIAAGRLRTCGLDGSGNGWCWGRALPPTTADVVAPAQVPGGLTFTEIGSGEDYACGLTPAGDIYCWGASDFGQLGNGSSSTMAVPTRVSGVNVYTALAVGEFHACALTAAGAAWCWGRNDSGQLGIGTGGARFTPTQVSGGKAFSALAAGSNHTCAIEAGGHAWCWGANTRGQLGEGSLAGMRNTPVRVSGPVTATAITAGADHACAITAGDAAVCWGYNEYGALGDGSTASRTIPTVVYGGFTFRSLQAGRLHTCGITTAGIGYCWGYNLSGQLGLGTNYVYTVPRRVIGQP